MTEPMGVMERALADAEQQAATALKAALLVTREVKKANAAAAVGQTRELRRACAAALTQWRSLGEVLEALSDTYDLDDEAYLAGGDYAKELMAAADVAGLALVEDDDRLLAYPSLIRVLAGEGAVEIDKVRERRLRPSVLIARLLAAQERPPRFRPEPFLDALRGAYDLVLAQGERQPDAVARLVDVWGVLTLLPGQGKDYSKQEFARDLYLLDQSGVASTGRDKRRLRFNASTGTKSAGVLTTVAKGGQQQRYWGVSFVAAGR